MATRIKWVDTRDMSADGHTKGVISRDLLLKAMRGVVELICPFKVHNSSKADNIDNVVHPATGDHRSNLGVPETGTTYFILN